MKLRSALAPVASLALLLATTSASATLTSSEKAQVRDFVAAARVADAGRVRSLVARTDLSADESATVLIEAVAPVTFTEARGAFLRELAFGAASAPSRPVLVQAVVKGLLARADAVLQKSASGLERDASALAELSAIYGYLDVHVANAGKPTTAAHDASAGVPSATYDECSKAMRDHVDHNARWLKGDGSIAPAVNPVRAQAQAALFDMLPDGTTRKFDAAERLGFTGARRRMLLEWGVVVADGGKLDEARAEQVRQILGKLPGARTDLALLFVADAPSTIHARGFVVQAPATPSGNDGTPFSDEVTAGTFDAQTSSITRALAVLVAKRALDAKTDLRAQAERDATAAVGDPSRLLGKPRAPSVDHVVGAAVHLLLLDPQRAVDLAFVRLLQGRAESAALLSDAIGALDGQGAPVSASALGSVRVAPAGFATGFTLGGKAWSIDRSGPAMAVTGATRDGKQLEMALLATAKTASKEPAASLSKK